MHWCYTVAACMHIKFLNLEVDRGFGLNSMISVNLSRATLVMVV